MNPSQSRTVLAVATNPAVDRILLAEGVGRGGVVRGRAFLETAGGKAAHVAMVARALGASPVVVARVGGRTGNLFAELLRRERIPGELVASDSETRGTYTVVDATEGDVLELHEPAAPSNDEDSERLLEAVGHRMGASSIVATCGSLPPGAPTDLHARVVEAARRAGAFVAVDTSDADALEAALAAGPDLVKPNLDEASTLVSAWAPRCRTSRDSVAAMALRLRDAGARFAWLTMADRGSIFAAAEGVWHLCAPRPLAVVNAVGCGDALLGGFVAGLSQDMSPLQSAVLGVAAAANKITQLHSGAVNPRAVKDIVPTITPIPVV